MPYNFGCLQAIDRMLTHWYFDNSRIHLDCCNGMYLNQHIHSVRYLNNRCTEFLVQNQPIQLTSLSSSVAAVVVSIAIFISTSLPILRILLRRHNDRFVLNRKGDVVLVWRLQDISVLKNEKQVLCSPAFYTKIKLSECCTALHTYFFSSLIRYK